MARELTPGPIRLFSRQRIADPFAVYESLRSECPVYLEPQTGAYLVMDYEDVMRVLKDPATFSSVNNVAPGARRPGMPPPLIAMDPPEHTRLRALLTKAFSARQVQRLEPFLREAVTDLLDSVDDRAPVDLAVALAEPLPVIAIAHMLGVPMARFPDFRRWSDTVVAVAGSAQGAAGDANITEMLEYFREVVHERRSRPTEDLITALVLAEVDGQLLSEEELIGFCWLLLVAGNETTMNQITNTLNILAERPDLWTAARADRTLLAPLIEEALRLDSPTQMLWRQAVRETEIAGVRIPAGASVLVGYGPANRDPREFEDPAAFRMDRSLNAHTAFSYGIHYCIGAPLARLETKVALEGLLDRYVSIAHTHDGQPERAGMTMLRGFHHLPLRLTRATPVST